MIFFRHKYADVIKMIKPDVINSAIDFDGRLTRQNSN